MILGTGGREPAGRVPGFIEGAVFQDAAVAGVIIVVLAAARLAAGSDDGVSGVARPSRIVRVGAAGLRRGRPVEVSETS